MVFKYRGGDRKIEEVVRYSREASGGYDSYLDSECTFLKVREGESQIRIMPRTWDVKKGLDPWHLFIWIHRNVGPDNGTYLCLEKMKGEACPLCEARHVSAEEAKALQVSKRAVAWVIDRDNERAGPQVISMPIKTLFRDINNRSMDKSAGLIRIDHHEHGYDVTFSREGTGLKTDYSNVTIARAPSRLCEDDKQQQAWLNFIEEHKLPEMLIFYPADHIERVLYGRVEEDRTRGVAEGEDRGGSRRRGRDEDRGKSDEQEDRGGSRGRSAPEDGGSRRRSEPEDRSAPWQEDEDENGGDAALYRSHEEERQRQREDALRRGDADESDGQEVPKSRSRELRDEDDRPMRRYAPEKAKDAPAKARDTDDEGEGDSPTDQARSRLSSLRESRRR